MTWQPEVAPDECPVTVVPFNPQIVYTVFQQGILHGVFSSRAAIANYFEFSKYAWVRYIGDVNSIRYEFDLPGNRRGLFLVMQEFIITE